MGGFFSQPPSQQFLNCCVKNDLRGLEKLVLKVPLNTFSPHVLDRLTDKDGLTPLMIASKNGHLDIVSFLVRTMHVNVNVKHNQSGATSLHYASSFNQVPIIVFLLDNGADPLCLTLKGQTAVDYARHSQQVHSLRMLETRTCVFTGKMKIQRSSRLQAGLGKLLGNRVKESLINSLGGELRECYVTVTNLFSCQPQEVVVREIAVYNSVLDTQPEFCFSFSEGLVTHVRDWHFLDVMVMRIPEELTLAVQNMPKAKKQLHFSQCLLTHKSSSSALKKLIFQSDQYENLRSLQQALKFPSQNSLCFLPASELNRQRPQSVNPPNATTTTTTLGVEENIPTYFLCPLTSQVMNDPVFTCDGISFERISITAYFAQVQGQPNFVAVVSPVTGMVLESTTLVSNLTLKQSIEEWKMCLPEASVVLV